MRRERSGRIEGGQHRHQPAGHRRGSHLSRVHRRAAHAYAARLVRRARGGVSRARGQVRRADVRAEVRTIPQHLIWQSVPIRLIAIDIDGTLLDSSGRVPPRNRRAVQHAADAGIHIVLATGRAYHHAVPITGELGQAAVLIVSNGALTKTAGGETLACRLLPRPTALAVLAALRPRHQGVAVIFDRPDARQYTFEGIDWSHPQRAWYY
ncbi:MAG: HAD hydrolase family protein, partial [Acidobacteria bacterium]|nr:HAD hydrolase family protein [Acidobacteriota bacterium]